MSTTRRDGTSTEPSHRRRLHTSLDHKIGIRAAHVQLLSRKWSFSPTTPKLDPERVLVALDAVTRVSRRCHDQHGTFTECSTPFELEKKDNRSSSPGDCG